ncbi:nitric oxide synthase oxygenase [Micromonospora sp. MED01]|uniref:nitric oxide synthase oxygenase n=1 Tax=Micromonospora alfalfae TaxID=2911212 RepID=UPI001EE8A4C6|nr:nitric oxide synthase oxygenase [Micromonospora alfalfae]MCG5466652.1 nitric oxide synthase oxygenase [Micromonospora alfalfae]
MNTADVANPSTSTTQNSVLDEAHAFLRLLHHETGQAGFTRRWRDVRAEITTTGTWRHTTRELTYGARVAWRNSARCIGRLRWQSLQVHDHRHATDVTAVQRALVSHLHQATNAGRIRSTITIFPPVPAGGSAPVRIINPQLVRYAAWTGRGHILGDPANLTLTRLATALGWPGPPDRRPFDILPWIVATDDGHLHALPVDQSDILEVQIQHPEHRWIADLSRRWPAVPVISNMLLSIGGVQYPAPFNGFFMGSEIAARNLADADRYHQTPAVIDGLKLDENDRLRHDKALLALQEAVLHSYDRAGVTITDHHRESEHFARFVRREEAAGRTVAGDWTWLNSYPMTPQDPSWKRYYSLAALRPALCPDPAAAIPAAGTGLKVPHTGSTATVAEPNHERAAPSTAAAVCPART